MFELRPSTIKDLPFLFEVHRLALRQCVEATWGWDDEEQRRLFADRFRPGVVQVIRLDGRDVGFLECDDQPSEINVLTIEILPEYQNRGIGSLFLARMISSAADRGGKVRLRVLKANRARKLYDRLGFKITEETDTHYHMAIVPEAV